jgi:hypothetical protein
MVMGTHLVVAAFAMLMQLGKGKRAWQYVWIIPLFYAVIAGIEALPYFNLYSKEQKLIHIFEVSVRYTTQATSGCQHGFRSFGL